jgi:hypothetical protein
LYQEGYFTVIAPLLNHHVWDALALYQTHLREPVEGKVRFNSLTLETLIETIRLCDEEHANFITGIVIGGKSIERSRNTPRHSD